MEMGKLEELTEEETKELSELVHSEPGLIEDDEFEIIKDFLYNNINIALDIAQQANSWDGRFEWCDVWDFEELAGSGIEPYDFGRAIVYGNVHDISDMVRYNGYGNLESVSEFDLESEAKDYIEDITKALLELYPNKIDSCYSDEIDELLNI